MIESRLVTPGVVDSFPEITKDNNYVDNLIWVSHLPLKLLLDLFP